MVYTTLDNSCFNYITSQALSFVWWQYHKGQCESKVQILAHDQCRQHYAGCHFLTSNEEYFSTKVVKHMGH